MVNKQNQHITAAGDNTTRVTDIRDWVTESEASQMLGLAAGKGSAWRHLRSHAPQIEQVELFGYTAVRRDVLRAYCENGRRRVYRGIKHKKRPLIGVNKSKSRDREMS